MKNKKLIHVIFLNIYLVILCFVYTSCITSNVPIETTYHAQVVYGYHDYWYKYHKPYYPPIPRRPVYVCPPPRDPYHPVWIQHPSYRTKHNGFGNIRKDIRVPGRVDSRPIYPKNKNFGGRR